MMKLLALSSLLYVASACLTLLADVSPTASELGPWAQLGTAGALAGVVWLLIGELRAARDDAAKQRQEHAGAIAADRDDSAKQREEFYAAFKVAGDRRHDEAAQDRAVMMEMVKTCSANRRAAEDRGENKKLGPGG